MGKKDTEEVKETKTEPKYSIDKLVKSKVFAKHKDILRALIKESEEVTITEALRRIEAFMKGGF